MYDWGLYPTCCIIQHVSRTVFMTYLAVTSVALLGSIIIILLSPFDLTNT